MDDQKLGNFIIEDARIIFRNFEGREGRYNNAGDRNFCVIINDDPVLINQLIEDGWNLKSLEPRDPEDHRTYYIPVEVRFNHYPPSIYLITKRGDRVISRVKLGEDSVGILDHADLVGIDLSIRPRVWDDNGKSRVKAFLKTGYFVIEQDEFASKYSEDELEEDVPF